MSITIRHVDGPLADQSKTFSAAVDEITLGRSDQCDIVFPPELSNIQPSHLKIARSDMGNLCLEVFGTGEAWISGGRVTNQDGPIQVESGIIVRLGSPKGPSVRIDTLAVTVKHLRGPLAGQEQTFDEAVEEIDFGRKAMHVRYPPDCLIVGKHHCELSRAGHGRYNVDIAERRTHCRTAAPENATGPCSS